ncbi:hypothetical protein [Luteolibacter sp. LG18]|uniref:hypothetical protein n=1 Tax=Luteolibacter sp. LG18 TaxID=2819286 RepID=UPI002B2CC61C|nr:hypothetical protein llg_26750 [Luteolibacter sp. LG18]
MPNNYKSDLVTKQEAAAQMQSAGVRDGDDLAGHLLYATAVVTAGVGGSTPVVPAAGDTLQLVDLPAGAVVVPQLSHVTGAVSGTLVLDIGDAGTSNRFGKVSMTGNAAATFSSNGLASAAVTPARLTDPVRMIATLGTVTSVPGGTKLVVTIAYRVKG